MIDPDETIWPPVPLSELLDMDDADDRQDETRTCEACRRTLNPWDNLMGRWCDSRCAEAQAISEEES